MVGTPLQQLVEWSSGGYPRPGAKHRPHSPLSSSPGDVQTGLFSRAKTPLSNSVCHF
ncbi:Hypothetical protein FKW44_003497 [Caligus rogercresseyi]|uniref:Uncharacterized protein n=1 Tax=Caligus rogercresseyi TaxID=217165 RepID=A0A7T8KLP6_CALRO|nr:Hypothetical protein FKW44_003497 [Caligus rogercresseyi]